MKHSLFLISLLIGCDRFAPLRLNSLSTLQKIKIDCVEIELYANSLGGFGIKLDVFNKSEMEVKVYPNRMRGLLNGKEILAEPFNKDDASNGILLLAANEKKSAFFRISNPRGTIFGDSVFSCQEKTFKMDTIRIN